jgi:hypothetical protein
MLGQMLGQIPPNKMPGRVFGQVVPRQIPGQVSGQFSGHLSGHLSGQFRGQIPGQIKEAPRPASAARAIMAQPNTAQSNRKASVAMPVRQGATPPAQVVPKIPGARVETRLTAR